MTDTERFNRGGRDSNLELYRIVVMLLIVAHHYVVNSGLMSADSPLMMNPSVANSVYLLLFGAWGKTGINCFLMITGYFMCTGKITVRKFLKLLLQIYLYRFLFYIVFFATGYETISLQRLFKLVMPIGGLSDGFTSCFLVFYLTIPFWNILIRNMTKYQHLMLLALLLTCYTLFGSLPNFRISYNYVTWFGVIYLIASYIRLYPFSAFEHRALWGCLTIGNILLASGTILGMNYLRGSNWFYFVSDCNKFFAVTIAICSFLWFKNMPIKYSKIINAFGAATFGVLLIHANSDAMRTWLWRDFIDCVGHYSLPLGQLVLYSLFVVLGVFVVCNLIDQIRKNTLEKWLFKWYDNIFSKKEERIVAMLTDKK